MSPDAVIGMLHMLDHWRLMLGQLQGEPLPALPEVPGRVHRLPEPLTVEQDAEQRDAETRAAAIWQALASDSEGGLID